MLDKKQNEFFDFYQSQKLQAFYKKSACKFYKDVLHYKTIVTRGGWSAEKNYLSPVLD